MRQRIKDGSIMGQAESLTEFEGISESKLLNKVTLSSIAEITIMKQKTLLYLDLGVCLETIHRKIILLRSCDFAMHVAS